MTTLMTKSELEQARSMINAGDLAGFYKYMADQGFNYALLAGGLVSGSFSGISAINYMIAVAKQEGVSFTPEKVSQLETDMANAWVSALEMIAGDGGTVGADLSYDETLDFHSKVFDSIGLSKDAWTLAIPGEVLGASYMDASWNNLLSELRNSAAGPLGSEAMLVSAMASASTDANDFSPQALALAGRWMAVNAEQLPADIGESFAALFKSAAPGGKRLKLAMVGKRRSIRIVQG